MFKQLQIIAQQEKQLRKVWKELALSRSEKRDLRRFVHLKIRGFLKDTLCTMGHSYKWKLGYYHRHSESVEGFTEDLAFLKERKLLYPILYELIRTLRLLKGADIHVVNGEIKETDRPIIFACTHVGKFDCERSAEVHGKHFYLFTNEPDAMYGSLDELFLRLEGAIQIDSNDKRDRTAGLEKIVEALQHGVNVQIYPEGMFNLSPNAIVEQYYFGCIDAALRGNALIVPIAMEQYGDDFWVNIGDFFDTVALRADLPSLAEREFKIAAITQLRDIHATLKWEIWEQFPIVHRPGLEPAYWTDYVKNRLAEYPYYEKEEHQRGVLIKLYDRELDIFADYDWNPRIPWVETC